MKSQSNFPNQGIACGAKDAAQPLFEFTVIESYLIG